MNVSSVLSAVRLHHFAGRVRPGMVQPAIDILSRLGFIELKSRRIQGEGFTGYFFELMDGSPLLQLTHLTEESGPGDEEHHVALEVLDVQETFASLSNLVRTWLCTMTMEPGGDGKVLVGIPEVFSFRFELVPYPLAKRVEDLHRSGMDGVGIAKALLDAGYHLDAASDALKQNKFAVSAHGVGSDHPVLQVSSGQGDRGPGGPLSQGFNIPIMWRRPGAKG